KISCYPYRQVTGRRQSHRDSSSDSGTPVTSFWLLLSHYYQTLVEYKDSKWPTSATLKDKVKKTRISSNSCSVIKRLKVEKKENDQNFSEKPASSTVENSLESQSSKHKGSESEENAQLKNTVKNVSACKSETVDSVIEKPKQGLNEEKALLVKQVRDKEELLRRLKLVKMYRSKNNLSQLEILISKWRNCSQLLLYELQSLMSEEKKITLTQLIDLYGLDDTLLHFNRSEEEFAGV
uniref:Swi5-dependent recombination DNA repair protein 1 homolog n=1 Tax=Spermophilus dauricus TaxID=99837 RepID=A0A8C9UUJ8_SPEDA